MMKSAHASLAAAFLAASWLVASGAAAAVTKFDGTYEGTMTGQSAAGASHAMGEGICADRLARSIAIADGKVSLVYNIESNVVLNGMIDTNGLFSAEAKRKTVPSTGYEWTLRMSGSVVGDYLTGQVWGKTCAYRIQMRKVVIKPS
jgi:hypothetical protein